MQIREKLTKKWHDFRELVELIREDYRTQNCEWTRPGFRAVAVHRFGVWVQTVGRPWLSHAVLKSIYNFLYVCVRNHYTIELPLTTKVGRRLAIGHQGGIVIHFFSQIGDDCTILQNVTLGAATAATIERGPILGDRVEVGCGAAIIGGVVIGNDVRIGPNAVVTMNVPAGSTVVAPPPRIVQLTKSPAPFTAPAVNAHHTHETVSQ
jgi:serine O-acetyltransferase